MGYQLDEHYKFACRTFQGTLGDLLQLFSAMPHDWTVRFTDADSHRKHYHSEPKHGSPDILETKGASITIKFATLHVMDWKSPTYDWLVGFVIDQLQSRSAQPGHDALECALFRYDMDSDHGHLFGIPTWQVVADTLGTQKPKAGQSVVEQLRAMVSQKPDESQT